MTTDRTTKLLLAVIALGLWVSILRPLFPSVPAQAQAGTETRPVLAIDPDMGVYVAQQGRIYRFKENLGQPAAEGKF